MLRRIVAYTLAYIVLIVCMTSGWHTTPLAIGLGIVIGLHAAGYRMADEHFKLSDRDLEALLRG